MLRPRKILGIALEEGAALVAEVRAANGRRRMTHAAEFRFPEGTLLTDPSPLGRRLGQWLKEQGFSARRAVFGVPAKWMLSKEERVPPADAQTVAGILRTRAERDFSFDPRDLALDYAAEANSAEISTVLLVAVTRERIAQINQIARAAGLDPIAVTSSVMALSCATAAQPDGVSCLLHLGPRWGELAVRTEGRFRLVRHLSWSGPAEHAAVQTSSRAIEDLAGELRRATAAVSPLGQSSTMDRLVLWNAAGLAPETLSTLGQDLFADGTIPGELSGLDLAAAPAPDETDRSRFAAAAALGLAGLRPRALLPLDFLHSRLAAYRKGIMERRFLRPVALSAAAAVALLFLLLDWSGGQRELGDLTARLEAMEPEIAQARDMTGKISFARSWYDTTPRFLECLRQITDAFPEEGTIWATSVALRAEGRGALSGKAVDEKAVLDVMDRMNAAAGFSDVKLLYVREASAGSREYSFAMSFGFAELR